jgi:hypothetical protein
MPEHLQGVLVEEFDHLTSSDLIVMIEALERLRSDEENSRARYNATHAKKLQETETSARALAVYNKLTSLDDAVKSKLGIRSYLIVPVDKIVVRRLAHAFNRKL